MTFCRPLVLTSCLLVPLAAAKAGPAELQPLIAQHAAANAVPESLVHRIIRRESNYNPTNSAGSYSFHALCETVGAPCNDNHRALMRGVFSLEGRLDETGTVADVRPAPEG